MHRLIPTCYCGGCNVVVSRQGRGAVPLVIYDSMNADLEFVNAAGEGTKLGKENRFSTCTTGRCDYYHEARKRRVWYN